MLFFISLPKVLKYAGIRGQNVVKKKNKNNTNNTVYLSGKQSMSM